jgi:hypothetical protein
MSLRFSAALIMGAALAASSLAHATTPGKATTASVPTKATGSAISSSVRSSSTPSVFHSISSPITIDSLARVEGILSYCATVDPTDAAQYRQALSNIISGHPSSEIKDDQSSTRYVYALGLLDTEIAKLPVSTVVSSCKTFLAGK